MTRKADPAGQGERTGLSRRQHTGAVLDFCRGSRVSRPPHRPVTAPAPHPILLVPDDGRERRRNRVPAAWKRYCARARHTRCAFSQRMSSAWTKNHRVANDFPEGAREVSDLTTDEHPRADQVHRRTSSNLRHQFPQRSRPWTTTIKIGGACYQHTAIRVGDTICVPMLFDWTVLPRSNA